MTNKKTREFKGNSLIDFPNTFVVIDLETTGLDPKYDRIIEISAIRVCNDTVIDKFSTLINPQIPIYSFITELTGINDEMVKNAPPIEDVLPNFKEFISDNILLGHNVNFDINFLYDNFLNINGYCLKNNYIDTMRLSRKILPQLDHHRLCDMSQYFNIINFNEHRALSDCDTTLKIFYKLKNLILQKYENIEFFKTECKNSSIIRANMFVGDPEHTDIDNMLYNKNIAVTGTLERFTRKEVFQLIADIGGICNDNVTAKTDFLILGNNDYNSILKGEKSSKLIKAENLKLKGQDIEILSENVFYDIISPYLSKYKDVYVSVTENRESLSTNTKEKEITITDDEQEIISHFIETAQNHSKNITYNFMSDKAISFQLRGIEIGRIKFNGKKRYCRLFAGDFKEHEWNDVDNPLKNKILEYIDDLFLYVDKEYKRYFVKYGDNC